MTALPNKHFWASEDESDQRPAAGRQIVIIWTADSNTAGEMEATAQNRELMVCGLCSTGINEVVVQRVKIV